MSTDVQPASKKPRGFQKGVSGNPGGRMDGKRFRAIVADLCGQITQTTGKPVSPAAACLVNQIATLMTKKRGDVVRTSRAVAELLARLGLTTTPEAPKPPSLTEYLKTRGGEPAHASNGSPGTQTAPDQHLAPEATP